MTQTSETSGVQLPPPLMTSEPGSYAEHTIVQRKPEIIRRVLSDHAYPAEIVRALAAFRDEIAAEPVAPLREHADDVAFWNAHQARYAGRTWRALPWFFAETYFYRRLLEAVRYLQPGPWAGVDPFAPQKREQEAQALAQLAPTWPRLAALAPEARFEALLHASLWGNRADLSNLTVVARANDGLSLHAERQNLLIDHTAGVAALLREGVAEVAFVNDNVGSDSLFDLALADFLLAAGWAGRVTFHLKDRPFFVSDAMPVDIQRVIAQMAAGTLAPLGARLADALDEGRLVLTTDPFWSRCLSFFALPDTLRAELARADLILLKGDVNYRRLLDDRHWPYETPLESVQQGFPRPYVTLRTLKGEIMVGLHAGQAEALAAEDPDWLTNGQRGVIHLVS